MREYFRPIRRLAGADSQMPYTDQSIDHQVQPSKDVQCAANNADDGNEPRSDPRRLRKSLDFLHIINWLVQLRGKMWLTIQALKM